MNVVIIGAGEMGSSLSNLLEEKKVIAELWDKDPDVVDGQSNLEDIIPSADFVFLCVPSRAIRAALEEIDPLLKEGAIVISLAKGIEENSMMTMDEVLDEALSSGVSFVLLSGPMLAEELDAGMMAGGMLASEEDSSLEKLQELFKDSRMEIDVSNDVHGVALAGVLKNIYAIALGFVGGMEYGNNAKGWMVTRALNEMSGIIERLGGKKESAYGSAGVGDLIATGFSGYSSNYQLGYELAKNGFSEVNSEGLMSVGSVVALLEDDVENFPILKTVSLVLLEGIHPEEIYKTLTADIT